MSLLPLPGIDDVKCLFHSSALALLLLLAQATAAEGPQFAGRWKLAVQTPNGITNPVLTIRSTDQGGYAGTYAGPRGTFEIAAIEVSGDTFSFPLTVEMPIGAIELEYRGTVNGDSIAGVVGNPRGEIPFTGERLKVQ